VRQTQRAITTRDQGFEYPLGGEAKLSSDRLRRKVLRIDGIFPELVTDAHPANAELDLKALAQATADRAVQLVPVKELQSLTGYIRGGVTALAGKKEYPVYADETIELFKIISISAGVRGMQILLAPLHYLRATKATVAPLTRSLTPR
jgi:Cys-tRNA(Pro) deacylase